jgi:transposase
LARAGELVSVIVPDGRDEAIRDLSRARVDAVRARLAARHQLKAMLLRHGHRYGRSSWTQAHERYLAKITFAHAAQDATFAEYRQAVSEANERVQRLVEALRDQCTTWRMQPVLEALMTLRGIDFVAAATLVAELGDLKRFAHPRELMSFLGLVPSEYTSGDARHLGKITKAGNGHVRRILIEAAWNYRFAARMSVVLQKRQEGQPKVVRDIAWRATATCAAIPAPQRAALASQQGLRCDRARVGRVYLGHRSPRADPRHANESTENRKW